MSKKTIKILDCTLRDGGYYTNWNFSKDFLNNYLSTVKALPISSIEVGYISDNKDDLGPFYHLDNKILKDIKSKIRKDQKLIAMINFKEIRSANHLKKILAKKEKYLDGIRFAIDPFNVNKLKKVISKNFTDRLKINLNLMYLSEWYNDLKKIQYVFNNLPKNIETLSFVDSYGAMNPNMIDYFFNEIENKYSQLYNYGCHFHNNCGLALANSITAMNINCSTVDTTFTGMGRGAGNAETELLLAYDDRKRKSIKGYTLNNFIELMNKLKIEYGWGSSFAYSFAAKNGYSQGAMMNLLQKRRLDPATALEVLSKKNDNQINFKNYKILTKIFSKNFPPILVGGGSNQIRYGNFLYNKISTYNTIIFSSVRSLINYSKIREKNNNIKILINSGNDIQKYDSSLIKKVFKLVDYILVEENFVKDVLRFFSKKKIITISTIANNPLLLSGLLIKKMKINKMYLAFFDGNPSSLQESIIMKETLDSLKKLSKKSIKFYSITENFFDIPKINPWLND